MPVVLSNPQSMKNGQSGASIHSGGELFALFLAVKTLPQIACKKESFGVRIPSFI
jgi:hypothetical protein